MSGLDEARHGLRNLPKGSHGRIILDALEAAERERDRLREALGEFVRWVDFASESQDGSGWDGASIYEIGATARAALGEEALKPVIRRGRSVDIADG